jgi:hypothetical protein
MRCHCVTLWFVCSKLLLVQRFQWPLAVVKVRTKGRPDSVTKSLTEAIFVVSLPFSAATLQLYEGPIASGILVDTDSK